MGKTDNKDAADARADADRETLGVLRASGVALLTSFRRDGRGIGTPVGIRLGDGKAYFTTRESTWKARRIANSPRVTLAPSTSGGRVTGPTVEGVARRMEGQEAELALRRAGLWGRMWILLYKVLAPGDRWIPYEVSRPAEDGGSDPAATTPPAPPRSAPA